MPSPALDAFQEKLANDGELQDKFVTALERFTRAVVDSGKANGHTFETQDVFRFIKGTYLSEATDAGSSNVLVALFSRAAGQSSATSQLSTLNIGQNPQLLEALQKAKPEATGTPVRETPRPPGVADTAPPERAPVANDRVDAPANAVVESPGEQVVPASSDAETPGGAQPDSRVAAPAEEPGVTDTQDGITPDEGANAWEKGSRSEGANPWEQGSGSSDSAWNQDKSPWWKFW